MLSFAAMLKAPITIPEPEVKPKTGRGKSDKNRAQHKRMRENSDRRYEEAFGGQDRTVRELAIRMGCSDIRRHMTRLEERGLVKRVGQRPNGWGNPPILWRWVGNASMEKKNDH